MVSPMASTCKTYTAGCTKTKAKILRPENSEKEKNAPGKGRKRRNRVRSGCWREVQPVRTGGKPKIRTKMHHMAIQHMKKENRRKPSVFAGFVAGAEGLEPSARGFGVDVGTHQRERRRGGVARSPRSSPQRAVLIWCYEESEVEKACRAISFSSPTTISFCLHRATGVGNEITTC